MEKINKKCKCNEIWYQLLRKYLNMKRGMTKVILWKVNKQYAY